MNKTEPFSSINEVSVRLDVPAHTLRYWEKQFPTVIKPTTGAGGRRYYRGETTAALESIKDLLYNRGMTIAGVKKMIKSGSPLVEGCPQGRVSSPKSEIKTETADITHAISLLEQARAILK